MTWQELINRYDENIASHGDNAPEATIGYIITSESRSMSDVGSEALCVLYNNIALREYWQWADGDSATDMEYPKFYANEIRKIFGTKALIEHTPSLIME